MANSLHRTELDRCARGKEYAVATGRKQGTSGRAHAWVIGFFVLGSVPVATCDLPGMLNEGKRNG